LWRIMILCGLRPGETVALRRNDVGTMLRVDEAFECRQFGPPKNRKSRLIPLPPDLRKELDRWMKDVPPGGDAAVHGVAK
jgi:integrase